MTSVTHVSFSSAGGAGETADILSKNMTKLGYSASLLTMSDSDLREKPFRNPIITGAAVLDNKIVKHRDWTSLITLSRSKLGSLGELVDLGQIVHHHWSQGVVNNSQLLHIARTGRRQAFTVNDMRFFTGACHYSFSCEGFESGCNKCPAVKPIFRKAVSNSSFRSTHTFRQLSLYSAPLVITPTAWMKKQIEKSRIGQNLEVYVVPNPIKDSFFERRPVRPCKPMDFIRVCIVAKFLDDPVKGVLRFVDEVLRMGVTKVEINLVGRFISGKQVFPRGVISHGWLEPEALRSLLDSVDYLVMPSIGEAAGNVIAEAAARGVPTLGLGGTGVENMVVDGETGFIFESIGSITSFLQTLHREELWQKLSAGAREKSSEWSGETVARSTINLYKDFFGPEVNFG